MLLEQIDKPFSDAQYVFEPKIDGHRLELSRSNGKTRLFTRHNNDVTSKYPELVTLQFDGTDLRDLSLMSASRFSIARSQIRQQ
ncbi:hypothetical protein [Brevibacillus reuszeri]|uniref:ATP-dependent DNA ligase n=1 Tax=Brevibacillus reuszeri TaxID=54915 RepID=UPI000B0FAA90|nr:hypothetical protein [Brevibacillus reuszeri]